MSELSAACDHKSSIRNRLLITASAVALTAYIVSTSVASAEDADQPTVWIEVGGQMEAMQGTSSPFISPFMSLPATAYQPSTLISDQQPSHHAFGLEGKVLFQPKGSSWMFSANVRYGRSDTKRHVHNQTAGPLFAFSAFGHQYSKYSTNQPFDDVKVLNRESHTLLDFQVGRDVGLGILGSESRSSISGGVRFAQFSTKSNVSIYARPKLDIAYPTFIGIRVPLPSFHNYTMIAHAERSIRGVGPSLSWNASSVISGSDEHTEFTFDWGVNAAVLFGRQKTKTNHTTQAYYLTATHVLPNSHVYAQAYPPRIINNPIRSRSIIIPNLGGFAGISVKYPNAKLSLGYRADFFLGAVDGGIDIRQEKNLGFHGPFATLSIGLGG